VCDDIRDSARLTVSADGSLLGLGDTEDLAELVLLRERKA
jgi:hypothetical protein